MSALTHNPNNEFMPLTVHSHKKGVVHDIEAGQKLTVVPDRTPHDPL
jgi:hypothetical protein